MRSESESVSLIALPSSCINSFRRSSRYASFPPKTQALSTPYLEWMRLAERKFHFLKVETIVMDQYADPQAQIPEIRVTLPISAGIGSAIRAPE
jgi:hypothetical protein